MDDVDEFESEVEALAITFPELSRPSREERRIIIPCVALAGDAIVTTVNLAIVAHADYPASALCVDLLDAKGAGADELASALAAVRAAAAARAGECSCFDVALAAQNEVDKIANAVVCCICLDAVRVDSSAADATVNLSACGHCLHSQCLARYARCAADSHTESDEYQATLRASRQAAAAAETPLRVARAAHKALQLELAREQARVVSAAAEAIDMQRQSESASGVDADVFLRAATLARHAETAAAAKVKTLRKDVSAAAARLGRASATFDAFLADQQTRLHVGGAASSELSAPRGTPGASASSLPTSVAVATASVMSGLVVVCPLCRCQLTPEDARAALTARDSTPGLHPGDLPAAAGSPSGAGILADAPLPTGLSPETAAYVKEFRARNADAYRRQKDGRCFAET